MNDTLKVAGRIGAELGAAKAEVERLSHKLERARDHLTHARHDVEIRANAGNDAARLVLKGIDQWLSDYDQSPDDTYTAVEMATAAAQGFRDGQAAVDPAPAQGELWAVHAQGPDELYAAFSRADAEQHAAALNALPMPDDIHVSAAEHWKYLAEQEREHATDLRAIATRPAQTEQQPTVKECLTVQPMAYAVFAANGNVVCFSTRRDHPSLVALESDGHSVVSLAPIAQTAPQGKFRMGDLVKKSTGSEWEGRVVGWYSTEQTKEGYAVESSAHRNSVQIYPVTALEAVE